MSYLDIIMLANLESERSVKKSLVKAYVIVSALFLIGAIFLFIGKDILEYQDALAAFDLLMATIFGCVSWVFKMQCKELDGAIALYKGKRKE